MSRKNSLQVNRSLYLIGIVTILVSVVWVGFEVYFTLNKITGLEIEKSIIEPISPGLDQETIKSLSKRLIIDSDASPSANIVSEDEKL